MSSLSSMLAVLQLFSPEEPVWSADGLIEKLGFSRPTGYRYVREMITHGLLVRVAPGAYSLGPRIIELDYQMRQSDPLLNAGLPVIHDLVAQTGCEINLIGLYGEHIVTTHQQHGPENLPLSFGRGRPLPLFRGAGSKVILAHFARAKLRRLFEAHEAEARAAGYTEGFEGFKAAMATIRRQGHALSEGELDAAFFGAATPVFTGDGEILGSVIAALSRQRLNITDLDRLVAFMKAGAQRITASMAGMGRPVLREAQRRA